ncbi:formylglycine-generating enzyme family protein [Aestuariivirga litoralis]|uniref:Formylglycine-generating enzyme family protein n=1 Tax=Aestuariivirga litoralis TaxID=2650924 RepID=A0A2W2B5P5_9HYPH|nr:SUMF1/EgtB/PvdO family nonheme iron enzyme [Aestuariivirga litoralis]PZF75448.1 formylglycine-generating enzyme family protein [Aestuariivirga litoralis]
MLALVSMLKWTAAAAGLSGLAVGAFLGLGHPRLDDIRFRPVAMPGGTSLQVMTREVTRREWRACADAGACEDLTGPIPSSEPELPMTGVNRFDVEAYLAWTNGKGGADFRLPTAAEWREIAAALPRRSYRKMFDDPRLAWAADYGSMPAVSGVIRPSGGFGALPNGIADLSGNVWEWTDSCAKDGFEPSRCPAYTVEGLHETALPIFVRDPFSGGCAAGTPPNHVGFRLVSED